MLQGALMVGGGRLMGLALMALMGAAQPAWAGTTGATRSALLAVSSSSWMGHRRRAAPSLAALCAGWTYLNDGGSTRPPAPAAVSGPAAAYYQEPVDLVSATLQLAGSGFQPLTQQSQQQAAAAVAQAVGQGVLAANVSVTLPQVRSVACQDVVPASNVRGTPHDL